MIYGNDEEFPIGASKVLRASEHDRVTIVAAGITLHEALAAHDRLVARGLRSRLIDAYSVKPIDAEAESSGRWHSVLQCANVIGVVVHRLVVAGLVAAPVVAVPTSVGYGASFEGLAALLAMLNSCAAGLAVVNIDNGFGAGHLACTILRSAARLTREKSR